MNNPRLSRAVKHATIFCINFLATLVTFTTNLASRRGWYAYLTIALVAFALLEGCGAGLITEIVPNDAKDIWIVGY